MGEQYQNSRIPEVTHGGTTFTWRRSPADGEGAVSYNRGDREIKLKYQGDEVRVPFDQVRWLAEVLLQVSDLKRVTHDSDAHDDYTAPSLGDRDRR